MRQNLPFPVQICAGCRGTRPHNKVLEADIAPVLRAVRGVCRTRGAAALPYIVHLKAENLDADSATSDGRQSRCSVVSTLAVHSHSLLGRDRLVGHWYQIQCHKHTSNAHRPGMVAQLLPFDLSTTYAVGPEVLHVVCLPTPRSQHLDDLVPILHERY